MDNSRLGIFGSRGCINQCVFCNEGRFWGFYRARSGENIFGEVVSHSQKYKISHFTFHDSLMNGNLKQMEAFCELIIERGLDISWDGQGLIRGDVTPPLLKKFRKAGCHSISYGMESGSDKVLRLMRKGFTRDIAERVIRDTHQAGISVTLNFMFGFPGEGEKEFNDTLDFIKRNREYISEVAPSSGFTVIVKGTHLFGNCKDYGVEDNPHHLYWETTDKKNTYPERMRRYEIFCKTALKLGLAGKGVQSTFPHKEERTRAYLATLRDFSSDSPK